MKILIIFVGVVTNKINRDFNKYCEPFDIEE